MSPSPSGSASVPSTVTLFRFDSPRTASTAADVLRDLVEAERIDVDSASTIRWDSDAPRPTARRLRELAAPGALGDMFWGLLLGVVFYAPLLAAAVGAPSNAVAGSLHDVGIDEGFVNRVRDEVTPGTSGLFVVGPRDSIDTLSDGFTGQGVHVVTTILSAEQEQALRQVFSE